MKISVRQVIGQIIVPDINYILRDINFKYVNTLTTTFPSGEPPSFKTPDKNISSSIIQFIKSITQKSVNTFRH